MGLDCSYDAFHGAYSAFNRFRQGVAEAIGGSHPPHKNPTHKDGTVFLPDHWYWGEGYSKKSHPGLHAFLAHSDCDGSIHPKTCLKVANDLEAILPKIAEVEASWSDGGGGHLARDGGLVEVTKRFIKGCRAAAAENKFLRFH